MVRRTDTMNPATAVVLTCRFHTNLRKDHDVRDPSPSSDDVTTIISWHMFMLSP